jgi:hypothetical protein
MLNQTVIYMSGCPLLDRLQLYVEVSVVFGLSIYIWSLQTAALLGMKICCWNLGVGGDFNKNVGLRVISEKIICSYLRVEDNPYPQDVS